MESHLPNNPGEVVAIDIYGPLPKGQFGMTYIVVLVDLFSKFVVFYPVRRATARTILRQLRQYYIPSVRRPLVILSDHGSQFTSLVWRNGLAAEGIQLRYTSVYSPQGNPAERVMREIGRILRAFCHQKHSSWVKMLPLAARWINITEHRSTGYTPYQLQQGCRPEEEITRLVKFPEVAENELSPDEIRILARERIRKTAAQRKKAADDRVKTTKFAVGDKVLVKTFRLSSAQNKETAKLFLLFEGPYYILKIVGPNAYLVGESNDKVLGTYNTRNLKPYIARM
ncbi:hypothetical protein B566_EDAN008953 [Ephemera danica]|nr:hypothetical protein B566_EDAN008953 [Ephemera danica]